MADKIASWLAELGLGKYVGLFAENEITFDALPHLTESDLRELGLPMGPRKILASGIAELTAPASPSDDAGAASSAQWHGEAERRQLTVMFCDLVGSTALSGRLDPEELRLVIQAYQNAVAGEAARFEGHVAKFMGDGVLVYFGWPRAHEDDAERAVRAALSILQAISGLESPDGAALAARIGIATGLVVVGDLVGDGASQEEAVIGETPNLAARLQALAEPGTVVIAAATRQLLGGLFELSDLGPQHLKGIAKPTTAFSVLGARAVASRFDARPAKSEAPMVGREQELALLKERWRLAKAGEGQMVLLIGEPGIGKSRITQGTIDAIESEPHYRILYQCSPYHGDSALYPAIQQLTWAAKIAPGDEAECKLDKLSDLVRQAGAEERRIVPLLAFLLEIEADARYGPLDLTPEQQRSRTLTALIELLIGLARNRPVLFILEDAHWSDPTTIELVEQCLDRAAAAAVLLLVTARPSFDHGFGGHPIVTRLTLNRLGRDQISAIVSRLSGDRPLPEGLLGEIAVKTDGVPLFVEELTKAVLESGVTGIPASLHDSLMSRLDRIPDVKEVAQIAAAIGRSFDYRLLMAIADRPEAELMSCLEKLTEAELVFRRGRPPEANYTFKHALVRDAAYESLLKSRRQNLHGKIVEALNAVFPETVEAQPELLAHHYTQAGDPLAAAEKWLLAGDRSARRAANREAIAQLRRGLDLVGTIDAGPTRWRLELDLLMTLGGCLRTSKGWIDEETVETVVQARRLDDALGGTAYRGPIGLGEYTIHLLRGELDRAVEHARDLLRLAGKEGSNVAPFVGHRGAGATLAHMGRFEEAREHLEAGLACYDPSVEQRMVHKVGYYSGVTLHAYLAHTLWHLGYADQSRQSLERAIALPNQLRHPPSQAFAWFQATFHNSPLLRDETAALRENIARFRALAREGGFATWSAFVDSQHAGLAIADGDRTAGVETVLRNLDWWRDNAGMLVLPALCEVLARAHAVAGRMSDALSSIDTALDFSSRSGERVHLAELYRRKGELLGAAATRDSGLMEASYEKALEIAREQSSRSSELRAATSLARLWADQGEGRKALDLLAPIYDWFTEGFDTADLKDAKALLSDLS
jgi:class 3 adenylate cyclase/tetratricopeptide (TPR) repeat protein